MTVQCNLLINPTVKKLGISVVAVVGLIILPLLLSSQYQVHMLDMILINVILALGLNIVKGFTGQITMGHYGLYAIGSYASALLALHGVNFWLAMPLAVLITALFGYMIGFPALRVEGAYLALTTLGFAESVRIILNNSTWAGESMGLVGIPPIAIGNFVFNDALKIYYFYLPFVLIIGILSFNLMRSTIGRRLLAIRDDSLAANVIGVNVSHMKLVAFMISAVFAGLAGSLYAHYVGYISPTNYTQNLMVTFMLMVVLGGLGHPWGGVVGAIIVTVLYEYTRQFVQYQMIAFGIIMIIIVLFMKKGIMGLVSDMVQTKKMKEQERLAKEVAS